MSDKTKLLIIEDEIAIQQGLVDVFIFHGFAVETAGDGQLGLLKAQSSAYDLILLDVMLPKLDGFQVCNQIRNKDPQQPIIMLTAKTADEDIINGLTLGADDYICKPFSVRELVLRVQSVLRRSLQNKTPNAVLQIGALRIDTALMQQLDSPKPLQFSRREISILHYLQQHQQRPVSREELLEKVWGYKQPENIETRTVDIHIAKLRRKIEADPKTPRILVTLRGEGYRLNS